MNDRYLDLRSYASALLRRWWLIVCLVLAFASVGLALSLYLRATSTIYEAQALVLISKPRYQVELEPKIKSSQDAVPASATVVARLQTLSLVAQGAEVEAAVQRRLGDRLPVERRHPG